MGSGWRRAPITGSDIEIQVDSATIARVDGTTVIRDLTWSMRSGQSWAIVGPTGCGKTTLAEALLGRHRLEMGTLCWPFIERLRARGHHISWPADVIQYLSFKEESWRFSYARHYYQQRFNFIEPQDDLTLAEFLGVRGRDLNEEVCRVARQLGVASLLDLSLIKISNGQMRRARIAKALLAQPKLLILDDPFLGLDAEARQYVSDLLGELIGQGMPVVLIAQPNNVPTWITHVMELQHGATSWQGTRAEYLARRSATHHADVQVPRTQVGDATHSMAGNSPLLIELRKVSVQYDGRAVLDHVTWSVARGERWAVLGPNGSGKSTLLSLLCGDHPQAYSNEVRLFGRRRGTGESIWEIKQEIGLVSPELHLYYSEPLSAFQTAATGFHDVLAYRPISPKQSATVQRMFDEFGIPQLADRPFRKLSAGEQRLVLLLRALVKRPQLLILDEPFQGLDEHSITRARSWLDERLALDQTLVFVTHIADEIPRSVNHVLRLDSGRVVECV